MNLAIWYAGKLTRQVDVRDLTEKKKQTMVHATVCRMFSLKMKIAYHAMHNTQIFQAATRIRTGDLVLTKDALYQLSHSSIPNGGRWIRTTEGGASRFTVCPLWPLGNSP